MRGKGKKGMKGKIKKVKKEKKKGKASQQARILWAFKKISAVFYTNNFNLITAHSVPYISANVNFEL